MEEGKKWRHEWRGAREALSAGGNRVNNELNVNRGKEKWKGKRGKMWVEEEVEECLPGKVKEEK